MSKEIFVGGKYKLTKRLGEGAFGKLYVGVNTKTGEEVAVKLERLNSQTSTLNYESKVLKLLQGHHGIAPSILWFGVEGEYNCLVMELLGPNLEQLFNFCDRQFTIPTTANIGL